MEKVKYFLKGTNKEVKVGDTLLSPNNERIFIVDEYALELLETLGILYTNKRKLETKKTLIEEANRLTLNEIKEKLAKRLKLLSADEVAHIIASMNSVNRGLTLSTWLREIAIILDEKYKDHISNCKEYWVFDLLQGRLKKIPRAYVKTFKYNALFRNLEDAKIACNITRALIKDMYGE